MIGCEKYELYKGMTLSDDGMIVRIYLSSTRKYFLGILSCLINPSTEWAPSYSSFLPSDSGIASLSRPPHRAGAPLKMRSDGGGPRPRRVREAQGWERRMDRGEGGREGGEESRFTTLHQRRSSSLILIGLIGCRETPLQFGMRRKSQIYH